MTMRFLLAAISLALALAVASSPAQSRPRHRHVHHAVASWQSAGLATAMARHLGTNPTGWRRAWCGQYLGMMARQAGLSPPAGYQLARNWRNAGHNAGGPAPGVVMVLAHHVGVVVAVLGGGRVLVRSGNHGRRVGDGVYATRRAIAWRRLV